MKKTDLISCTLIFGLILSLTSCQYFFVPMRNYLDENGVKPIETGDPLPGKTPVSNSSVYFDDTNFFIYEKDSDGNETKNSPVFRTSSSSGTTEWGYYANKNNDYTIELAINNSLNIDISSMVYVSQDGNKLLKNLVIAGISNLALDYDNNKVSMSLSSLMLNQLSSFLSNSWTPAKFYFYLYDEEGNLQDLISLFVYISSNSSYSPSVQFNPKIGLDGFKMEPCFGISKKIEFDQTYENSHNVYDANIYFSSVDKRNAGDTYVIKIFVPLKGNTDQLTNISMDIQSNSKTVVTDCDIENPYMAIIELPKSSETSTESWKLIISMTEKKGYNNYSADKIILNLNIIEED